MAGACLGMVHKFGVVPDNTTTVVATICFLLEFSAHGQVPVGAFSENLFAVQFHPEKSQHAGLQLLKNFINWDGQS